MGHPFAGCPARAASGAGFVDTPCPCGASLNWIHPTNVTKDSESPLANRVVNPGASFMPLLIHFQSKELHTKDFEC